MAGVPTWAALPAVQAGQIALFRGLGSWTYEQNASESKRSPPPSEPRTPTLSDGEPMTITLLNRPAAIDDATRRQFLIGGASLAALLAGCSTSAPSPEPPAAAPGFPVTINHKYGSTEINKVPERVVAVGLTEQDTLLALGVTPVATREWFGEQPGALWPWARTAAGTAPVPDVLAYELNYEKIAALRPDLILGWCGE